MKKILRKLLAIFDPEFFDNKEETVIHQTAKGNGNIQQVHSGVGRNVVINGQVVSGDLNGGNVSVTRDGVFINGKKHSFPQEKEITIVVNGSVNKLEVDTGNTIVNGDVGAIESDTGNVKVSGKVNGDIELDTGNVTCGDVAGNVKVDTGNIRRS